MPERSTDPLTTLAAERDEWQRRFSELESASRSATAERDRLQSELAARQAELQQALAQAQAEARRLRVAYAHGLPLDFAARLQGADDAQLAEDARRLATFLKPSSPGVPPASAGAPAPPLDLKRMTPAEIRQARADGKI